MSSALVVNKMLAVASEFCATHIEPNAANWERERRLPREIIAAAGAKGLCGLLVPADSGGSELSVGELIEVMERLAYADMGFTFSLVVHNNLAGAIAREGSQSHCERHLNPLLDGSALGAFLLTEPGTGTNAAAIQTTASAIEPGGRWLLNGEKAWVTNATEADLLRVYAQTDPGSGAKGIAAFLVRADQPGVVRGSPYEMLGAHATGAGGFRFENVELESDQLFNPPGVAYRAAMNGIRLARVVVAAMCVGILRRGLDTAVSYLGERSAFGSRLSEYQGLRWMLADVATDIEAAAGLTRIAAQAVDADSSDAAVATAHAKKFAARAATQGLAQCMQALGANGFRHDLPVARHFAAARMAHYLDGTTEVQNLVIAKALFDKQS